MLIEIADLPVPLMEDIFKADPPECGCTRTSRFLVACTFHHGWYRGWTRAAGGPPRTLPAGGRESSAQPDRRAVRQECLRMALDHLATFGEGQGNTPSGAFHLASLLETFVLGGTD